MTALLLFMAYILAFWERPREWLVTKRLQRHIAARTGWRCTLAAWICDRVLDPFDPRGEHC